MSVGDEREWVILVCPECDALVPDRGHSLCSHRADANTGELVKVAPADQLRGAVEALREIADAWDEVLRSPDEVGAPEAGFNAAIARARQLGGAA